MRPSREGAGGAGDVVARAGARAAGAGGGHGVWLRRVLRMRRAPARWRLPARVRGRAGGVRRGARSRDRARGGAVTVSFCGLELAHRLINGSGTFDVHAARRSFGAALDEQFPFAAFVSKTITLEPRTGNPPPRLWESAQGLINSIGLPNRGLEEYMREELPLLAGLRTQV